MPTCPDWTVLDLVAHQGMVHRWAAALLRGERPSDEEVSAYDRAGRDSADPLAWLVDGASALVDAISAAPEDVAAPVFLNDAPPARAFWARRQCHETTMHAVDALAASLGRAPRPDEVWIDPELAGDGIDELLGGFLTRPRSRLRCDDEAVLLVSPRRPAGLVGGLDGPAAGHHHADVTDDEPMSTPTGSSPAPPSSSTCGSGTARTHRRSGAG